MLSTINRSKARGMSMISVLVATAITGIMIVAVMLIVDQVTRAIAKNAANDVIEIAVRTIQGIVTNKDLCDNALRGNTSATRLSFPDTGDIPIDRIYAQSASGESANNTLVLRNNSNLGAGYRVSAMTFGKRPGEVGADLVLAGVNYRTYAGQISLTIQDAGSMRVRTIPYNAVVGPPPDRFIERCFQDSSIQFMCEQLGGSYNVATGVCSQLLQNTAVDCSVQLAGGPLDCTPGEPPLTRCHNLYYVAGFTPTGNPICQCQKVCTGVVTGGVAGGVPGGAPGSPGSPGAPGGPGTTSGGGGN